jgi:phage host-nuclease inhibitor protein Gam
MLTFPTPHAVIQTRQQLHAVVENIVLMRAEQAGLISAQESAIAAVREKYRAPLADVDRCLQKESAWVEAWANAHPGEFSETRVLLCPSATIGFRAASPRVACTNRKWSWSAAAQKLAETAWGSRYLRTPVPEIDREALLADQEKLSSDDLQAAGLKIVQGDQFFIEPHAQETIAPESTWKEAA